MESRMVEPEGLNLSEEEGVSDALREAVEEELEFLESRGIKLIRMRADDEGDVFQITIHAGDEMYRMSEVAPGNVSRTVFRNPEKDGAMPYQEETEEEAEEDEETEEEAGEEEDASGEDDGEDEKTESEEKKGGSEETRDEEDSDKKDAEESEDKEDAGEENESEGK